MISVTDLRPGMTFQLDGNFFVVLDASHNKTARAAANVRVKMKNLRTGGTTERTFGGSDKVSRAQVEKNKMQYLYNAGEELVFMDNETYDQIEIQKDRLTWEMNFLTPNLEVDISMYENEILGLILPDKVELQLVECEPAVKGDTATNALKNAKCETGLEVRVPLFIENEERILVSTADGKYSSRA